MNLFKKYIYRILKNLKFLPKPWFFKFRHGAYTGKELNLENPIEITEKINWLKLYYHPPILTQLTDKYEVRAYVTSQIGSQYLNDLYGYYTSVDAINWEQLPDSFILKAVHGCRKNLIVTDKSKLNLAQTQKLLRQWMHYNHYKKVGFEWAYKNIKPGIIAEKLLFEKNKKSLTDYKLYYANGKFLFLYLVQDFDGIQFQAFYDHNFEQTEINSINRSHHITDQHQVQKPINWEEMLHISQKLAGHFPYVRVDLYNIENKIIFGEMTFYPGDARYPFTPDYYNTIIGNQVQLPILEKGQKEITNY